MMMNQPDPAQPRHARIFDLLRSNNSFVPKVNRVRALDPEIAARLIETANRSLGVTRAVTPSRQVALLELAQVSRTSVAEAVLTRIRPMSPAAR